MTSNHKPKVLVLCTGNSMRSQMAEGLLQNFLGDQVDVYSAGTHPSYVHPNTIKALAEIGIDISHHKSKSVNQFVGQDIDLVITVCDSAKVNCPVLPGARKTIHHPYDDPYDLGPSEDLDTVFAVLREKMRSELIPLVRKELALS
ncbi:MAG: arsenate reductase ArsC [Calditrichaeota bacterium]|nr:arsenate reductase ArsC [Calditrichota bacterium]MCB9368097.1 arsenate reductase ArsC [Calditrichota bacterium]